MDTAKTMIDAASQCQMASRTNCLCFTMYNPLHVKSFDVFFRFKISSVLINIIPANFVKQNSPFSRA